MTVRLAFRGTPRMAYASRSGRSTIAPVCAIRTVNGIGPKIEPMTTATRPEVRIAERAGFCYGVRRDEFEKVKGAPDLEVIDATCTWVLQSQKAARELAEAGYTVCIIGHEDHPEVKGVRSYAGEKHVVVDDMDRSTWERVPRTKKIGVLSQSTILPNKLEEFAAFCLRRAHDLRVINTVCPVTLTRQDDSVKLAAEVDAMIVVGGKNSSNTRELAVKCAEVCADTIHVADAEELAAEWADWVRGKARIGITGGTSTPEVDLEEVRDRVYALTAA